MQLTVSAAFQNLLTTLYVHIVNKSLDSIRLNPKPENPKAQPTNSKRATP